MGASCSWLLALLDTGSIIIPLAMANTIASSQLVSIGLAFQDINHSWLASQHTLFPDPFDNPIAFTILKM